MAKGPNITQTAIDKLQARAQTLKLWLKTLDDAELKVPEIYADGRLAERRKNYAQLLEKTMADIRGSAAA